MKSTPYEKYFLTFILKISLINNNLEKIANVIYSQALHEKLTPMTEKERDLVFSDYYICMLIRDPDETSLENIKRRLFEMFWETRNPKEHLEYQTMVRTLSQLQSQHGKSNHNALRKAFNLKRTISGKLP